MIDAYPRVSIIVPTFNSEKTIERCIDSLFKIDYPKDKLEIIVIDNSSKDRTSSILKKYKNIIYLAEKRQSAARARNRGIAHSKGEIIAFTDSDCVVDRNWVKELMKPFKNRDTVCVAGLTVFKGQSTVINKAAEKRGLGAYVRWMDQGERGLSWAPTCNLAVKRDVLEKVGGFTEAFRGAAGEDIDLCWKIGKLGYQIIFNNRAIVYHIREAWNSLPKILSKFFSRGRAEAILLEYFPERSVSSLPSFTLIFVFLLICSFIGCFFDFRLLSIPFVYLVIYLALDCIFGILSKKKRINWSQRNNLTPENFLEYLTLFSIKFFYDIGFLTYRILKLRSPFYRLIHDPRRLMEIKEDEKREKGLNLFALPIAILVVIIILCLA